jgi:hypothetical protein
MEKKKRGRPKKTKDFDTDKGILNWIDADLFQGVKKRAKSISKGATGGALPQLDGTIRNITAKKVQGSGAISDSTIRTINESAQAVKNNQNSISSLETRIQDLTVKSNKTIGMLGELMTEFNEYKKNINKTLDEFKNKFQKLDTKQGPGAIESALGSISDLMDIDSSKNKKTTKSMTGGKAPAVAAKTGLLKSVGSLAKGGLSRIPAVSGLIEGVTEYIEGGDIGRSIAVGAGNILGTIIGGAVGTIVAPGVGTALGGIAGSMAGADLAKKGYDWLFGGRSPKESDAVKKAREDQEKQGTKNVERESTSPGLIDRIGEFFGLKPKEKTAGTEDKTGLNTGSNIKGVGETGNAKEAVNFFVQKGWTREQSAGIVGNLQMESGADMKTDSVGDAGKAYGIAQWHPDRQGLFKKTYGKDIREAGFKEQLEFVNWELNNNEIKAGEALRTAKSAQEAAIIFDAKYERSSGAHRQRRIANSVALMQSTENGDDAERKDTNPTNSAPGTQQAVSTEKESVAGARPSYSQGYMASPGEIPGGRNTTKPENVVLENSRVNLSSVNEDLLSRFYALAHEYGKPVQISSAQRDDAYQAELWARGSLGEPGIYTPAKPKQAQRVTIKNGPFSGRTIDVPGGGQGSAHTEGKAIDTPATKDPAFRSLLPKFGLTIPFGDRDPVHVQKIGDSIGISGGSDNTQATSQNRVSTEPAGGAQQISAQNRPSIMSPQSISGTGAGRSFGGLGAQTIPNIVTRTQPSRIEPYGIPAIAPQIGPISGIMNALAMGGTKSMQQFPVNAIAGLLTSMLAPAQRAQNPTFMPERFQDNRVPSAMPSDNITRELFGMNVSNGYYP